MSDADEKLRALAAKATPGPWEFSGAATGGAVGVDNGTFRIANTDFAWIDGAQDDAEFIAAANPVAVLSLLDRLAAVEAENEQLRRENETLRASDGDFRELDRQWSARWRSDCAGIERAFRERDESDAYRLAALAERDRLAEDQRATDERNQFLRQQAGEQAQRIGGLRKELRGTAAERDQARQALQEVTAENERLRELLGIAQWPADMEPVNVREVAATEVRKLVAAERDQTQAWVRLVIAQERDLFCDCDTDLPHWRSTCPDTPVAAALAGPVGVPAEQPEQTTAYEACSSCGGSGMQDHLNGVGECYTCGGDTVVRARDETGKFTTLPVAADLMDRPIPSVAVTESFDHGLAADPQED